MAEPEDLMLPVALERPFRRGWIGWSKVWAREKGTAMTRRKRDIKLFVAPQRIACCKAREDHHGLQTYSLAFVRNIDLHEECFGVV
jgi:hypothetical protein